MKAARLPRLRLRGTTTIEFAASLLAFIIALFVMLDVCRALFMWNALAGVTRTVARTAIVNAPFGAAVDSARSTAILAVNGSSSYLGSEVTTDAIQVKYLNLAFNAVAATSANSSTNRTTCHNNPAADDCIRFVQVQICKPNTSPCAPLTFTPLLPLFGPISIVPTFVTILPAQGLGCTPGTDC